MPGHHLLVDLEGSVRGLQVRYAELFRIASCSENSGRGKKQLTVSKMASSELAAISVPSIHQSTKRERVRGEETLKTISITYCCSVVVKGRDV